MIHPEYDQQQLHQLSFSKSREILLVNEAGSYCSTSISTCNTRKYHGLLVSPQPEIDGENHVLLSCLDDTVISGQQEFPLSVHEYPGVHHPEGHLLMEHFSWEDFPRWTYRADGIHIIKEIILAQKEERIFIRYSFNQPGIRLRIVPFIACRNAHTLLQPGHHPDAKTELTENGMMLRIAENYEPLHFQASAPTEFIYSPDWYKNIEYSQERERGYEFRESLFIPGYFEIDLKDRREVIFCTGTTPLKSSEIAKSFGSEKKNKKVPKDLEACLRKAASQFIVQKKQGTEIIAGWPWFGRWGRDTFIALPGLTLATHRPEIFEAVIAGMLPDFREGLFPNTGKGATAAYNAADTSLWFIRALQLYTAYTAKPELTWKKYSEAISGILENYRSGTHSHIKMLDNGLLFAEKNGVALTWMDAIVEGFPVTPRGGLAVELNGLWYNAVCFALELAAAAKDNTFINNWQSIPSLIEKFFTETFWNEEKGYLADCVGLQPDWSLRPNQLIAIALPFSPVSKKTAIAVLQKAEEELVTPRGLRTLSPGDHRYKGIYSGNQQERDLAYHEGTVWPWLLGYYAEACIRVRGKAALETIARLYHGFEAAVSEYGIATLPEIYDGDYPHLPKGCIAQAWSVAELLRIKQMLRQNRYRIPPKKRLAHSTKQLT